MTKRTVNVRFIVSTLLELAGIAAIAGGCALFSIPVGVIVGGIGLLAIARAIDPPRPADSPGEVE